MAHRSDSSRWAWILPVGIIVLGVVELTVLVLLGRAVSLWLPLLLVALGFIVAFALVVTAGHQSFTRLRSLVRAVRGRGDVQKHMSRPAFTLLAAAAFAFPGVLTDILGIVLLLTPVQRRAIERTGLSSASGASQRFLLRNRSGVVTGSIIVDNEKPRDGAGGAGGSGGTGPGSEPRKAIEP